MEPSGMPTLMGTSANFRLEYVLFVFCLEGNWITTEEEIG